MLREFKEFAIKGNVVDMAVGVMIGAAFGKITASLVDDVLMPPLGILLGGFDFSRHHLVLRSGATPGPYASVAQARDAGASVIAYGQFLNTVVSFVLLALCLFLLVRWMNRLRSPATPPAPNTKPCPYCTLSIHETATRCPHCTSEQPTPAA